MAMGSLDKTALCRRKANENKLDEDSSLHPSACARWAYRPCSGCPATTILSITNYVYWALCSILLVYNIYKQNRHNAYTLDIRWHWQIDVEMARPDDNNIDNNIKNENNNNNNTTTYIRRKPYASSLGSSWRKSVIAAPVRCQLVWLYSVYRPTLSELIVTAVRPVVQMVDLLLRVIQIMLYA